MSIHVTSERQVIQEAVQVLIQHMSPANATRFWASWQAGEGNYLLIREQLFDKETVPTLYQQIEEFQNTKNKR